jgi:Mrp family chromosome partitioning ATPase
MSRENGEPVPQPDVKKLELRVIERVAGMPPPDNQPDSPSPTALAVRQHAQVSVIPAKGWSAPVVVVIEEVGLPSSLDPRLVVLSEPSSAAARNYRLLQHRLVARSDPRVIAVTSALPGEGKTTCAANLALVLADQTFARVLLVEANVRRPALAQTFGFDPADSFIDRLVQDRDSPPPYLVARICGTRLHVAALRSHAPRGLRLDRLRLHLALSALRDCYDYIVIDAASVFESADADIVGECADGVLIAARAEKSRRAPIRRAIEQLSPAPMLGVVLLDT